MNGKSLIIAVVAVIGLSLTLVGMVVGGVIYVGKLDSRLQQVEGKRLRPDPWTGKDALFWSVQLKEANPHLVIPIPKHQSDE